MKKILFISFFWCLSYMCFSQTEEIRLVENKQGVKLQINQNDFIINGMNWGYFPIGTNYEYSLWEQPEEIIKQALDYEMALLQKIGVNAIRVYEGIPPKWITYIFENYGIYTMLNHSFGRYGLMLNDEWQPSTDYSDKQTQNILLKQVQEMVDLYKNTPGLLLYLLGNENNYGLFWGGAETEDFPDEKEQIKQTGEIKGRPMYSLMNQATLLIKKTSPNALVAICNGDLLYLDIIAEECKDVDIFGTNSYRGESFGDLFDRVKKEYGKPVLFTEFGADAYNAIKQKEDQEAQAHYLICNWEDIYQNAAGNGRANNAIGGFTFQFSDGWWKFGQTTNLDKHDTDASWANAGYAFDFEEGKNNMNEEWFGVCAKGPTNSKGVSQLYPRLAYYALKEIHKIKPYQQEVDYAYLDKAFKSIQQQIKNKDTHTSKK